MPIGEPYHPKAISNEHHTPADLFDALDQEFGLFTFDPACDGTEYTAKVIAKRGGTLCLPPGSTKPRTLNLTRAKAMFDGLAQDWSGLVFLNPPYGKGVERWVAKAVHEVEAGNCDLICALLKSTTDVRWWQKYVLKEVRTIDHIDSPDNLYMVRFLKGRLKFEGQTGPAPFPSAVVVWAK